MKLSTLKKRRTIRQGQFDDLKLETSTRRVWLSRMTIADGMPYENQVTEEVYNAHEGKWVTMKQYEAK